MLRGQIVELQKKEVAKLEESSVKTFENDPLKQLVATLEGENAKLKQDIAQYMKQIAELLAQSTESQAI
jgi:hypothetical protein